MSDKVNAQEIIDGLQLAATKPIGESFTLSGNISADDNTIKSGDRCLNLIGSNLVVYSGDTEEQKRQREEIISLLKRLLQADDLRGENAQAVRDAVHCALQTERAIPASKKYCVTCLTECGEGAKFCPQCGKDDFAPTMKKAVSINARRKKKAALKEDGVAMRFSKRKNALFAFLFLTLCVALIVTLPAVFGSMKRWQVQNLVGALGGAMFLSDVWLLLWVVKGKKIHLPGVFVFGLVMIVNTLLAFLLKRWYWITSFWINAYLLFDFFLLFLFTIGEGREIKPYCIAITFLEFLLTIASIVLVAVSV